MRFCLPFPLVLLALLALMPARRAEAYELGTTTDPAFGVSDTAPYGAGEVRVSATWIGPTTIAADFWNSRPDLEAGTGFVVDYVVHWVEYSSPFVGGGKYNFPAIGPIHVRSAAGQFRVGRGVRETARRHLIETGPNASYLRVEITGLQMLEFRNAEASR